MLRVEIAEVVIRIDLRTFVLSQTIEGGWPGSRPTPRAHRLSALRLRVTAEAIPPQLGKSPDERAQQDHNTNCDIIMHRGFRHRVSQYEGCRDEPDRDDSQNPW